MTVSRYAVVKKPWLFALGLVVAAAGVALVAAGLDDFWVRSVGILLIIAAVLIGRASRGAEMSLRARARVVGAGGHQGPGFVAWAVAVVSVLVSVSFYFAMFSDAAHGGRHPWLLDAFGVSAIAVVCAWGYIIVRLNG